MQKLSAPLVGAQGIALEQENCLIYQRFPLSKPVVGRNIVLDAVPAYSYRASTYLVSACPAHSTSFSPILFNPQWWNVY